MRTLRRTGTTLEEGLSWGHIADNADAGNQFDHPAQVHRSRSTPRPIVNTVNVGLNAYCSSNLSNSARFDEHARNMAACRICSRAQTITANAGHDARLRK